MTRNLLVILLLGACGRLRTESCDPTETPTVNWAMEQLLVTTGKYAPQDYRDAVAITHGDTDLGARNVFSVWYDPSVHLPTEQLGFVYQCTLYTRLSDLATRVLADQGWTAAPAAKRVELARTFAARHVAGEMTPPKVWTEREPFAPVTATTLDNGGVRIDQWTRQVVNMEHDSTETRWVKQTLTFAPNATLTVTP